MPYLSNPKLWGPGVWFNIHLLAAKADDAESKEFYITYINTVINNLPCMECRKHAGKYLEEHPLVSFLTDSDPEGLFRWSWIFHNFVNTRLHKPFIDWKTAHDMFYNENGVCAGDCGSFKSKHRVSVYNKNKSKRHGARSKIGVTHIEW